MAIWLGKSNAKLIVLVTFSIFETFLNKATNLEFNILLVRMTSVYLWSPEGAVSQLLILYFSNLV